MMQKTFGMFAGLDELMPIAPHPTDEFICEDTGEWKRRDEVLFSYDGKAWWWEDDRYDYEATALATLAETLEEWVEDYIDHDDSISDVVSHAFSNDSWREYVADYYDDCDDCIGHTEYQMEMICNDLRDRADTVVKTYGYSNFGYDLTSWDVGEVNETVYLNDHPLLKTLHERDVLEGMLDDYDCNHEFVSHGRPAKFVSGGNYPSITLSICSDKTYWWGCSHEIMYEVYHEHIASD